ncbi:hypothetical protein DW322_15415 [Rhodococcus rhodnii]|uniref:Uncharacterized protein n=2 Tax=Rhodococcus rhodnii TaxID=38312 RepID=R7WTI0_9NOCA|nr:hypothetical protein [Rhodococcus rhodnii]EOM78558.1 hypothetical protein Rrhod_0096 [Rhodococcus rhodnii LMG 5362]TXG91344.1 hypothetical protein DW322_15415 [Rhodococcus rhodnii]
MMLYAPIVVGLVVVVVLLLLAPPHAAPPPPPQRAAPARRRRNATLVGAFGAVAATGTVLTIVSIVAAAQGMALLWSGVVLVGLVGLLAATRRDTRAREQSARAATEREIAARAERQHRRYLDDDPYGTFGDYPPDGTPRS